MKDQISNDKNLKGDKEQQEDKDRDGKKEKVLLFLFKYLLSKLKLRHLIFLLVAVIGLSLTAAVIIILWRISSPRITGTSDKDYISIIGVLVAFVAALMGVMATIMFGNSVYSSFMAQKAIEKIERHDKTLPDLYVLTLRNEANECEEKGDILRAIECRIGVIHNVLKSRNCTFSNLNFYTDALKKTVSLLNEDKFLKYYLGSTKSSAEMHQEIEDFQKNIHWRIGNLYKSENGFLVASYMKEVKTEIDTVLNNIKSKLIGDD